MRSADDVEDVLLRVLDYGVVVLAALVIQLTAVATLGPVFGFEASVTPIIWSELAVGVVLAAGVAGILLVDVRRTRQVA